jgi:hypothetical protein
MNSIESINLTNIRNAQNVPSIPILNFDNNLLLNRNNYVNRQTESHNNQLNLVNNNNGQSSENEARSISFDPLSNNIRNNNNNNYISNFSFTLEVSYDEDDDEDDDFNNEENNNNNNLNENNNNNNDNIDELISLSSEAPNETSIINSNDICLDTSFGDNITLLNGLTNRNNNANNSQLNNNHQHIRRINHLNQINPIDINISNIHNDINNINNRINEFNNNFTLQHINTKKNKKKIKKLNKVSKHKRKLSAPLQLINEFQEFKYSSQYIHLLKAFLYSNNLILIRGEDRFDTDSETGASSCKKFLNQIESLMLSFGLKGENREYRKKFSKAYFYLFDKKKLCFLTEIFGSAQETTPFLVVNGEEYNFSKEVLEYGNILINSFCSLIMTINDVVKNIRDELFFNDIKKVKNEIKESLIAFDKNWVKYEEKYIFELIEIEKKSRKLIIDAINIENEITNYENKLNLRGKLVLNDKRYDQLRIKLIEIILNLNKVANIEGKGRSDLPVDILFNAEKVLVTVSENQSKGMRNLAFKIKNSLQNLRILLRKYSKNIEEIDPQLKNNKKLAKLLYDFENKWEQGKIYLLDKKKFNQLLFFSQIIEIICEKYNKYSIRELIENNDPSIFISLPSILLLKAIYKEDQNICQEYITGLHDKNTESGKLFYEIRSIQKRMKNIIKDKNKTYNLLEKLILFDNTKEQNDIEKEIKLYINENIIKDIKNGLTNLSMHLQRYKPTEWNTFFELAMDIKIINNGENNYDVIDKSITTEIYSQYDSLTTLENNSDDYIDFNI